MASKTVTMATRAAPALRQMTLRRAAAATHLLLEATNVAVVTPE